MARHKMVGFCVLGSAWAGGSQNQAYWDVEEHVCTYVGPGHAGTCVCGGEAPCQGTAGWGGTAAQRALLEFHALLVCILFFFLGVDPSALNNLNVSGRSGGGFQYTSSVSATWLLTGLVFHVLQRQESSVQLAGMGRCHDAGSGVRMLGKPILNGFLTVLHPGEVDTSPRCCCIWAGADGQCPSPLDLVTLQGTIAGEHADDGGASC